MTATDLPTGLDWVYGPDTAERPALDALLGLDGSDNPFRLYSTARLSSGCEPHAFDAHITAARDRWRPTTPVHQLLAAVAGAMSDPGSDVFAVASASDIVARLWAERAPAADLRRVAAGGESFEQQLPIAVGVRALLEVQCATPDPLNGFSAARTETGDLLLAVNVGSQPQAPRLQGRLMSPPELLTAAQQITGLARDLHAAAAPGEPALTPASFYLALAGAGPDGPLQQSIDRFRHRQGRSDPWLAAPQQRDFALMGALASALGPERTTELAGVGRLPQRATGSDRSPAVRRTPRPRRR